LSGHRRDDAHQMQAVPAAQRALPHVAQWKREERLGELPSAEPGRLLRCRGRLLGLDQEGVSDR
jgi:hypothetical protein